MSSKRKADELFDAVRPSLVPSATRTCNRLPVAPAATSWQGIFGRKVPTAAAPRKRSAPKAPAQQEQLYLDFGQKSFGRQTKCAICGMLFTEGEPRDEEMHRRHHLKVTHGALMRPTATERVVRCSTPPKSSSSDVLIRA